MAGLAQLVRAPGCGSGGRGFDPHSSPHKKSGQYYWPFFMFMLNGIASKDSSIPVILIKIGDNIEKNYYIF